MIIVIIVLVKLYKVYSLICLMNLYFIENIEYWEEKVRGYICFWCWNECLLLFLIF